jgi:hypothetical protein
LQEREIKSLFASIFCAVILKFGSAISLTDLITPEIVHAWRGVSTQDLVSALSVKILQNSSEDRGTVRLALKASRTVRKLAGNAASSVILSAFYSLKGPPHFK